MTLAVPRQRSHLAWILFPALVLGLVFVYPLTLMVMEAFADPSGGHGIQAFLAVIERGTLHKALFATVRIALAATSLCLVLGYTLALMIRFIAFPGARALGRLIDAYLAFPSFLIALSLTFLYGNAGILHTLWAALDGSGTDAAGGNFLYGFWGVVLAEVTYYTPFVMRPVLAALDSLDTAQLEVASSLGEKPFGVLRRVVLPATLPALLAGGSLCLLLTINEFGIILIMGVKHLITLPMLIYGKAINEFDYQAASAIALCNIALSLGLYVVYRRAVDASGR